MKISAGRVAVFEKSAVLFVFEKRTPMVPKGVLVGPKPADKPFAVHSGKNSRTQYQGMSFLPDKEIADHHGQFHRCPSVLTILNASAVGKGMADCRTVSMGQVGVAERKRPGDK
jgi:hypothetical protein